MLSPKTALVTANLGAFDDMTRGIWLPILAGSRLYSVASSNFPDIVGRLAGVETGSLRAKQLNETLKLIDKIGPVDAGVNNNQGEYSTLENREDLIEYAFAVIYGNDMMPRLLPSGGMTPNVRVI